MITRYRLYRTFGFTRASSAYYACNVALFVIVAIMAMAFALTFVGCGGSPTQPDVPTWTSHTYTCRTQLICADDNAPSLCYSYVYIVPPGNGTCHPGDTTVDIR